MRSTSRHFLAISSLAVVLAVAGLASPAAAKGDSAMILHTALVKPIKDTDRYSESMGAGADIRWIPRREWMTMSFGGFASIGRATPSLTARDFYDFHFNLGVKSVSKREAGIIPYATLGLDVLAMTIHEKSRTVTGTTLGINADIGFMGYLSKRVVYRASVTYLGAITPGTGEDLGSLVFNLGVGYVFED